VGFDSGEANEIEQIINTVCVAGQGLANSVVWMTSDAFVSSFTAWCSKKTKLPAKRKQNKNGGVLPYPPESHFLINSAEGDTSYNATSTTY